MITTPTPTQAQERLYDFLVMKANTGQFLTPKECQTIHLIEYKRNTKKQ